MYRVSNGKNLMTKTQGLALAAVLVCLSIPLARASSEVEPNNSCQSAQSIGSVPAKSVSGTIDSGDVDYFKLQATPGTFLSIALKGSPSGAGTIANTALTAFTSSCIQLTRSSTSSGEARLLVETPADGKLRLAAMGLSGNTGTYTMKVTAPVGVYGRVTEKNSSDQPHIGQVSFSVCQDPQYELCLYYYAPNAPVQVDYNTASFLVDTSNLATGRYQLAISGSSKSGKALDIWRSPPLDLVKGESEQLGPELEPMAAQISALSVCPSPIPAGNSCDLQYQVLNTTAEDLLIELRASIQVTSGGPVLESAFDLGSKGGPTPIEKTVAAGQTATVKQSISVPNNLPSGSSGMVTIYAYRQGEPQRVIGALSILYYTVGSSGAAQISVQDTDTPFEALQPAR